MAHEGRIVTCRITPCSFLLGLGHTTTTTTTTGTRAILLMMVVVTIGLEVASQGVRGRFPGDWMMKLVSPGRLV